MAKKNLSNNDVIDSGSPQAQVIVLHPYPKEKAAQDYYDLVSAQLAVHSADLLIERPEPKVAQKHEIAVLRQELLVLKVELKLEIADRQQELLQGFADLEQEIDQFGIRMDKKFFKLRLWIIGNFIVSAAVMVALMTYFNHR